MFKLGEWILLSGYRSKPSDKVGWSSTKIVFEIKHHNKSKVSGNVIWSNNDSFVHVGQRVSFNKKSLIKSWSKIVKLSHQEINKLVLLRSL